MFYCAKKSPSRDSFASRTSMVSSFHPQLSNQRERHYWNTPLRTLSRTHYSSGNWRLLLWTSENIRCYLISFHRPHFKSSLTRRFTVVVINVVSSTFRLRFGADTCLAIKCFRVGVWWGMKVFKVEDKMCWRWMTIFVINDLKLTIIYHWNKVEMKQIYIVLKYFNPMEHINRTKRM